MSQFIYRYAECHYAECRYAECCYAYCCYAECHYAECRSAECHYAECRSAECHYAKCHGALDTAQNVSYLLAPCRVPVTFSFCGLFSLCLHKKFIRL